MRDTTTSLREYCVGFAFFGKYVLLVSKLKPIWQRGLLNGVGGEIEAKETPVQAMVREFREEVQLDTAERDWRELCVESGPGYELHAFAIDFPRHVRDGVSPVNDVGESLVMEDWRHVERLQAVINLPWMLALAQDARTMTVRVSSFTDIVGSPSTTGQFRRRE